MQDFKQEERVRAFPLDNGNTLYAKQTDPYGFWYLNLDKGQLPARFTGAYNNFDQVQREVERYKTDRNFAAAEVKKKVQ